MVKIVVEKEVDEKLFAEELINKIIHSNVRAIQFEAKEDAKTLLDQHIKPISDYLGSLGYLLHKIDSCSGTMYKDRYMVMEDQSYVYTTINKTF